MRTSGLGRRLLHVPSADWDGTQIRTALRSRRAEPGAVARLEAVAERSLGIPVIAFGSARAAIAALIMVARPPGARVTTQAFTCVAVPNAIVTAGGQADWIDIDGPEASPNAQAAAIRRAAGGRGIVIAQHTYGVPIAPALLSEARGFGAFVIEDRAHRFDGADVGGDAVVFSLEHSKVVSCGQGGLAWARDPAVAAQLRTLRDGWPTIDDPTAAQILRTSAVQAGLSRLGGPGSGVTGLARRIARRVPIVSIPAQTADELAGRGVDLIRLHPSLAEAGIRSVQRSTATNDHRREIATAYREAIPELIPSWLPIEAALVRLPIVVDDAAAVTARLRAQGWDFGPRWFDAPVHPDGSVSDYPAGAAPQAERLAARVLTLPTHARIDRKTAARVAEAVFDAAGR